MFSLSPEMTQIEKKKNQIINQTSNNFPYKVKAVHVIQKEMADHKKVGIVTNSCFQFGIGEMKNLTQFGKSAKKGLGMLNFN